MTTRRAALTTMLVLAGSPSVFAQPPARVVVVEAVQQEIAAGQTYVANVMPLKRAVVGSAVAGRVTELVAHEGQRVDQGRPLVKLLTETIELELAVAEAEMNLRRQELAELQNGSRPNEIAQAHAKMLAAKANVASTAARRQRLEELRGARAVSQGDFDEALAAATYAEQSYYDLKAAYELAIEGPRPEKIAQAQARLAVQQAMVDQIKDRIKKYTIISRFDGYVVAEFVEEGAWVQTGDPIMEVVALDEVEVQASIAEEHVPFIEPGMSVRVEVPAIPQRMFSGVVTTIVPQADMRARTFPIKIRMRNEIGEAGPLLKSGMYARVELPTGSSHQAVMVPKDALVFGGPRPIVYAVEGRDAERGKANQVPVELGVATPNLIQVTGALKPGQLVVVEGNERLRPGQDVIITRIVQPKLADAVGNQPEAASHATD